jgi:flagellar motor switch protein FliN/FliY
MNDSTKDSDEAVTDEWAAAMQEQEASTQDAEQGEENYESAEFENLTNEDLTSIGERSLDMILDIPVTMSVEIGRSRINISNLLKLNQGSVVELDRLAGEPMDVMVNGTLIAHGEVVVVNEKFGIRLTDVVTPSERVKNLK